VQANVPERELSVIQEGDTVAVTVDAYPGRQFAGRVTYIADQVDPNTGTVAVRCDVPNPDGALRANMFATANIASPLGRDAVLVPDEPYRMWMVRQWSLFPPVPDTSRGKSFARE